VPVPKGEILDHSTVVQRNSAEKRIRRATVSDISALLEVENRSFESDRLTRRNFNYLLKRGNAVCIVETVGTVDDVAGRAADGRITGYVLLLFNAGTSLARLYSFAVDPDFRRTGVAYRLLDSAEREARDHECVYIRLEVRRDNEPAISLYRNAGYREFGIYRDYYADHMEALRLEKRLRPATGPSGRVPYYEQTLDFTCGPSALMMAMKALDPALELNRVLELRIWRESTTIFMTSGHGGCGPYGLALSAWRRGFDVELVLNDDRALFLDSVRSEEKKEVLRLVQEEMQKEIVETDIRVSYRSFAAGELTELVESGAIPVVLISSYRIYHEKFPHWVVVAGSDERFFYVHDPLVETAKHTSDTDRVNMPILKKDFERMARYGKAQLKAMVVLRSRQDQH
jgi:ribosomal protein S18 acetylase RimI-like enzyme